MRKYLLLPGLLVAVSAAGQFKAPVTSTFENTGVQLLHKWEKQILDREPFVHQRQGLLTKEESVQLQQQQLTAARSATTGGWQEMSKSMNVFGVTIGEAEPLQYQDELNVVSFVHRKSPDYVPKPMPTSSSAETGVIVGVFTNDWGNTWDTTLLWNNDDYHGRYPQGAVYNPDTSNKCLTGAYLVASGPVTGITGGWQGSFFGMKSLYEMKDSKNSDSISNVIQHTQFIANTAPFPQGKFDYPSFGFTITDDGVVRTLGYLVDNVNGTGSAFGWKGASLLKGTYINNALYWESDSIIPEIYTSPGGTLHVSGTPHMAWNESGTVGYVWFIGVRKPRPGMGDTLSNMGFQPIIYKTTNSGATWAEMPRINFNDTTGGKWNQVFSQMFSVRNDTLGIPFFNVSEGLDGIVDRNDRLHIVSTVVGTFSKHPDSLGFTYLFTHKDGQRYNYRHTTGLRPFIFDFTETSQGWNVTLIDSMSSEGPGSLTGTDGYGDNPWNEYNGRKIDSEARLQMSRTADGRYIIYAWTQSDTAFTFQNRKWNNMPNVMVRMAEIGQELPSTVAGMTLHPMRINVTSPVSAAVPPYALSAKVADKAMNYFISPKTQLAGMSSNGPAILLPITVSNNNFVPMKQEEPITHWYLSAQLDFGLVSNLNYTGYKCTLGLDELEEGARFTMYPNPSTGHVSIEFESAPASSMIVVLNALGDVVQTIHVPEVVGHPVSVDMSGLAPGVYLVSEGQGGKGKKLVITR